MYYERIYQGPLMTNCQVSASVVLAVFASLSASSQTARPHPAQVKAPTVKLVLGIVVDQFRYDYTTRFAGRYTQGLHRLLTEGAVFTDAHQDHYPTVTATGHATFMTGSTPATSGIIGNEWYDRMQGRSVTSVEDAGTKLLGGAAGATGSSPHNLVVSTVGDEMKIASSGKSHVIGISMKDRAAILPVGRMADAAYWLDDTTGQVVSSTWYQQAEPAWVQQFNAGKPAERDLGRSWTGPGAEQPFVVLPKLAGKPYVAAWETTPWSNDMLESFAEQALAEERLGQHEAVDMLTVSFSANDHLGHVVGPNAPAVEEMSVATDAAIGRLIAAAERQVGKGNLLVVMTADHGVAPTPEFSLAHHLPAGRANKAQYARTVQDALAARFGDGKWIVGTWESGFYFNHELLTAKHLNEVDVENEAASAVATLPYVERTYTRTELMRRDAMASRVDDYVARSFFPEHSPDLFVVLKPYWLFGTEGTSHGSPWDYDTHVPLIFMGAGIYPGVYDSRVGISDVAPTLTNLLHLETPSGSVGRVLDEALSGSHPVSHHTR
jgi:predicted AlkP superfamily pyrophosphatase or phosphodiesterase